MSETKPMFEDFMTNPKVGAFLITLANGSSWASQNFDLILARGTAIASFILIIVMIRKYLKDTGKK